jgi:hypothetical protein
MSEWRDSGFCLLSSNPVIDSILCKNLLRDGRILAVFIDLLKNVWLGFIGWVYAFMLFYAFCLFYAFFIYYKITVYIIKELYIIKHKHMHKHI